MFQPVGPQQPSVYWRRRLMLLGSLALLVVLFAVTVKTVAGGGGGSANASPRTNPPDSSPAAPASHPSTSSTVQTRHTSPSSSSGSSGSLSGSSPRSSSGASSTGSSSSAAAPATCDPTNLAIAAVAAQTSYHVGDQPVLELQVTNPGPQPCAQDLADKQVELKVYNGASRVWGSHDCQVQPGTNMRTLAVNTPVRVAITWSGLSSQPNCAGTRQRVGPGTYTLYATLSGHTGKAAQFTVS
jgi:hypothetical protein